MTDSEPGQSTIAGDDAGKPDADEPGGLGPRDLKVEIIVEDPRWRRLTHANTHADVRRAIDTAALAAHKACLAGTGVQAAATADAPGRPGVSILLTDDVRMRDLNAAYRGVDRATNVLAFPADLNATPDFADDEQLLGDIVLALETLEREADAAGISPLDYLAHLIVHAVLHLHGYDHQDDAGALEMEALEVRILAGLGIADPYGEEARRHVPHGA